MKQWEALVGIAIGIGLGLVACRGIAVIAPASPQAISNTASIALGPQTDRNPADDAVTVTVTPR